jgi:signal transduction histidine kinase
MCATLAVFGVAVFAAHNASQYRDAEARAKLRGDLAVGVLRRTVSAITVTPKQEFSSGFQRNTTDLLQMLPGFLLVLNKDGYILYESPQAGGLSYPDSVDVDDAIQVLHGGAPSAVVNLGDSSYVLVQTRQPNAFYGELRVISGADAPSIVTSALQLLGAVLVVLPLLLGISIGGAYVIADRALRPLETVTSEVTAITDGRSLHRRLPLVSEDDELTRLTLQLNSMIARLEKSFGALRRFTADASHELKTPLAVLRADVEHAMRASANGDEQLEALEEALQETARMADLVESLLMLARADEGRFDLHREPLRLEPLVHDVVETAHLLAEAASVQVAVPVLEDATIMGDLSRLRQLFLNLVTNALKYTPTGGRVEISLTRTGGEVEFSVRDTGIGISAADLPHVFERFWRADRARSRSGERGGYGLGLAIGQWIAQAHGGALTVQSRLHRGSTFTVTLPVAPPDVVAAAEAAGELPELRATG